jgi:hypothetical protein
MHHVILPVQVAPIHAEDLLSANAMKSAQAKPSEQLDLIVVLRILDAGTELFRCQENWVTVLGLKSFNLRHRVTADRRRFSFIDAPPKEPTHVALIIVLRFISALNCILPAEQIIAANRVDRMAAQALPEAVKYATRIFPSGDLAAIGEFAEELFDPLVEITSGSLSAVTIEADFLCSQIAMLIDIVDVFVGLGEVREEITVSLGAGDALRDSNHKQLPVTPGYRAGS